jgi:malate dehydrogenase
VEGLPQGKALDLAEAAPLLGHDLQVVGTNNYADTAGSVVVVVTSGIARQPGMSRDDLLLKKNEEVVASCIGSVMKYSKNPYIIVVTNPLDAMCHVALKASGFPRWRVIGMAGVLDTARFRTFISMELGFAPSNTTAFVLGGHGDTMVPLPRYSTVGGVPITELMTPEQIERIIERTRNGGAEIVSLLKTGSAYYAPAAAVWEMIDAIVNDRHKILPCAAMLRGEYGVDGLFVGVPVRLGRVGVDQIVEIDLLPDERAAFARSAGAVRELVETLGDYA